MYVWDVGCEGGIICCAGMCVKTKTDKGEKIFINICKSEQVYIYV